MNVVAHFDQRARATPGATALAWDQETLSYAELRQLAQALAARLATRAIGADDRVAILLGNDPASAVALLGVLWRGAVATVLSSAWTPADAAAALERADARLLITTRSHAAAIGAEAATTLLVDDDASATLSARFGGIAATSDEPPTVRGPADVATILFSSGTTTDPKGVVLTHGNLSFNARSKIRYCGIAPSDRLALVVPIAHCFGQNVVLLGALLGGAAVRIYPRFDAAQASADIARGEVTMLLAAPTAFHRLLALESPASLRPLRYALTAAAPLPDGLAARWRDATGKSLAQGYGLTECSPFATYSASAAESGRAVGRPIDGVEVRIASIEGDRWAMPGEEGEIAIRGPNVMRGYWRRPDLTARALRGGWLRTGDVGTMDAQGEVHLIDRVDDVINVAGFKAYPSDVERALARHPAVREVAAYASVDATRGACVAAAIVPHDGMTIVPSALMRFAAPHLAGFQRPARVRMVDALPRSASGKVLRRQLAAEDHRAIHESPAKSERLATGWPVASR